TLYPIYRAMAHYAAPLNVPVLVGLMFLQMLPLAIVFGPFAAYLVEVFPARIRYTSSSLPYHVGNGWCVGVLLLISRAIVARTGNAYAWLSYPIAVLVLSVIVGSVFVTDHYRRRLWDEAGGVGVVGV